MKVLKASLLCCIMLNFVGCKSTNTESDGSDTKSAGQSRKWEDVTVDENGVQSSCSKSPAGCMIKDPVSGFLWGKIHQIQLRNVNDTRYKNNGTVVSSTPGKAMASYGIDVLPWCNSFQDGEWRVPDQREFLAAYKNGILDAAKNNRKPSPMTFENLTKNWFWAYSYDENKREVTNIFKFPGTTSTSREQAQTAFIICVQGKSIYPHY